MFLTKKCKLTNWLPPIKRNTIDIETNSWFDIKYTENPYAILVEEYETIILLSHRNLINNK
jgi:hypothetical protein